MLRVFFTSLRQRSCNVIGHRVASNAATSRPGVCYLNDSDYPLHVVEFVRYGKRDLGVIKRPVDRRRWVVWTDTGATVQIMLDNITYHFPQELFPTSPEHPSPPLHTLRDLDVRAAGLLQHARVRAHGLWAVFVNEGTVDLSRAAERLFGQRSALHEYAAFRFCCENRAYFRYADSSSSPCHLVSFLIMSGNFCSRR
jgi:hypothetical protein